MRGLFIVIEGTDKSGKTTQVRRLADSLKKASPVEIISFPDRDTPIGKLLDGYLKGKVDLDDHAVHLLFSANRWQMDSTIKYLLESGITVIADRY